MHNIIGYIGSQVLYIQKSNPYQKMYCIHSFHVRAVRKWNQLGKQKLVRKQSVVCLLMPLQCFNLLCCPLSMMKTRVKLIELY